MSDDAYSRPLAAAQALGGVAADRHRFNHKRVLLTGTPEALGAPSGSDCLLYSLRLLGRICRHVVVAIPLGFTRLEEEARRVGASIAFGSPFHHACASAVDPGKFDAVLSVGTRLPPGGRGTVFNSDGWLARVSSTACELPLLRAPRNPIGSLAAASLAVAEVFKELIALKPERGEPFDALSFSLQTLEVGTTDPGPEVPASLVLPPTALVGAGAIGNAVALLLADLPLRGEISVIDRQRFGRENLGTCVLIGPHDVGRAKAVVMADFLRSSGLAARPMEGEIEQLSTRFEVESRFPEIVLNGLDNIEARHAVQGLWPDLVIDGAIGAFMAQVSRHAWSSDVGCLLCLFPAPSGQDSTAIASDETGLRRDRVLEVDALVGEADVEAAPLEKQQWLRERLGRPICSVVSQAMVARISKADLQPGFEPSVPFVAAMSAAMVGAELVKALMGAKSQLRPQYQFDLLVGPQAGVLSPLRRRTDCVCVVRRKNLDAVRAQRKGTVAPGAPLRAA
jgi:molybdopterin/thiamine biosynthesis adenylyltransferase